MGARWLLEDRNAREGARAAENGAASPAASVRREWGPYCRDALLQPDLGPASSGRSLRSARAEPAAEENDDLVPVAVATFGVSAAAMGVGALAHLVRLRLGLVKPHPAPEEGHESH